MGQLRKDAFVRIAVVGHRIEFESRPPVVRPKPPPVGRLNKEREKVVQEEVDSLLRKGTVERARDKDRGFYSIFLVAKKDGGLRPVINLSGLDVYIKKKTFRMASLKYCIPISLQWRLGSHKTRKTLTCMSP